MALSTHSDHKFNQSPGSGSSSLTPESLGLGLSEEQVAKLKRTSQNRLAQRAYRARKDNKIRELESTVYELMQARRVCRCRFGGQEQLQHASVMERQLAALMTENSMLRHRIGDSARVHAPYFQAPYSYHQYPRYAPVMYGSPSAYYNVTPQNQPYAVPAESNHSEYNASETKIESAHVEEHAHHAKKNVISQPSPFLNPTQSSPPAKLANPQKRRGIHFLLDDVDAEKPPL
ncbi:hypothetical protein BJ741DRAFT_577553 [Chytriomyces cf. hyalinus JEL632]|nr:hypothetical protein BJ741DRAFT_577553 [Chytriomyces cf. hyalinus JEL632]